MARYLVRDHDCWCDSCFCSCLHEAYDLQEKKSIQMRVGGTGNSIVWSWGPATTASYINRGYQVHNLEQEAISRNLIK